MNKLEECNKYSLDFPKLTKSNSFIHQGRVIVVIGKDFEGNDIKARNGLNDKGKVRYKTCAIAYDHKTKIQLCYHTDKDEAIEFIKNQDLGVLDEWERTSYKLY